MDSEPTRIAYDVRSEQTGRLVIVDVPLEVAEAEAERLNAEASRPIGDVPVDGRRILHAGEQLGKGPTTYVVAEVRAIDERAHAAQLADEAAQMRAQVAEAADDADERAALERGAERLDEAAARATEAAAEVEQTHRAALEGLERA